MKASIKERMEYLEELIDIKKKELSKAPQEVLNICHHGNRVQYYKKNPMDGKRKYIKKQDKKTIERLCQKDYNQKVIRMAEKELQYLKKMLADYPVEVCENLYEQLSVNRKNFVVPILLTDEDFAEQWLQQEYPRKGFREGMPEYYTDNGERVRSKSEILIANALKKHNIPYRYEAPLYLNGLGTIHPDFTVLNVRERKEYYWEHMGKMDEPEYIEQALQRIDAYEKNNIFPGDKLILSHETLQHPINSRNIEGMIFQYLQ